MEEMKVATADGAASDLQNNIPVFDDPRFWDID